MQKTIWLLVVLVVIGIVGYNGVKVYQFFTSPNEIESTDSPQPSPDFQLSRSPITSDYPALSPNPTPEPALTPKPVLERQALANYFAVSEVDGFVSFSAKGKDALSDPLSPLAFKRETIMGRLSNYLGTTSDVFTKLLSVAQRTSCIITTNKHKFLQFTFEKEAEAVLKDLNLSTGSMSNLLVLVDNEIILGSDKAIQTKRLLENTPLVQGSGSYAEELGSSSEMAIYVSVNASLFTTPTHPLLNLYTTKLSQLNVSLRDNGISTIELRTEKSPDWVNGIARDAKIASAPFIPADSPFSFICSFPVEGDRSLSTRVLWNLLFKESDREPQKQAFKDNLGISPSKFVDFVRSRFYVYFAGIDDLSPENSVFGFDLPHSVSVKDFLKAIQPGDFFLNKPPATVLFNSRKVYIPDAETDEAPAFSVASLDNFVLASANHQALIRSVQEYPLKEGYLSNLDKSQKAIITQGASAILRFDATRIWPECLDILPAVPTYGEISTGFKFSRGVAQINTDFPPGGYMLMLFDWLSQQP